METMERKSMIGMTGIAWNVGSSSDLRCAEWLFPTNQIFPQDNIIGVGVAVRCADSNHVRRVERKKHGGVEEHHARTEKKSWRYGVVCRFKVLRMTAYRCKLKQRKDVVGRRI